MRNSYPCRTLLTAAMLLCAVGATRAEVITYDFTTTVGNGFFSYDDQNTSTLATPPWGATGPTYYAATAYRFGGVDYASAVIQVANNFVDVIDGFVIGGSLSFQEPSVNFSSTNLTVFSDGSLSSLNALRLLDFDDLNLAVDAAGATGTVTSLQRRSAVPEPGAIALLLTAGLAAWGATRAGRRRQA